LRLRVGIGRPERGDVTPYVLGVFSADQQAILPDLIARAGRAVAAVIQDGLRAAANRYNAAPEHNDS